MVHPCNVLERVMWCVQYLAKPTDAWHHQHNVYKMQWKISNFSDYYFKFGEDIKCVFRTKNNETSDYYVG